MCEELLGGIASSAGEEESADDAEEEAPQSRPMRSAGSVKTRKVG